MHLFPEASLAEHPIQSHRPACGRSSRRNPKRAITHFKRDRRGLGPTITAGGRKHTERHSPEEVGKPIRVHRILVGPRSMHDATRLPIARLLNRCKRSRVDRARHLSKPSGPLSPSNAPIRECPLVRAGRSSLTTDRDSSKPSRYTSRGGLFHHIADHVAHPQTAMPERCAREETPFASGPDMGCRSSTIPRHGTTGGRWVREISVHDGHHPRRGCAGAQSRSPAHVVALAEHDALVGLGYLVLSRRGAGIWVAPPEPYGRHPFGPVRSTARLPDRARLAPGPRARGLAVE
jgi:hypothetical protein